MVVAVAEESRGADHARPWIEQAKSDYWQLIDTEHRLEDLYNLVNVPQAIWIDEQGKIVRPPETAGSTDHFRGMDLKTRTMSPKAQEERLAARQAYMDAVRAWVDHRQARAAGRCRARRPAQGDAGDRRSAGAFPAGRLAARARACGRRRPADGRGEQAASGCLEPVAPGRRSRRGRQGIGAGVLEARAGAGREALLSASQALGRSDASFVARSRDAAGRQGARQAGLEVRRLADGVARSHALRLFRSYGRSRLLRRLRAQQSAGGDRGLRRHRARSRRWRAATDGNAACRDQRSAAVALSVARRKASGRNEATRPARGQPALLPAGGRDGTDRRHGRRPSQPCRQPDSRGLWARGVYWTLPVR